MTLESDPVRENNPTANASGQANAQTRQTEPNVPRTVGIPAPPPPKAHCEITYNTEKDFWDHVKTGAEIIGIVLLAIYTGYTIKMYRANKKAADAAASAATTAAAQLELTERPWLVPSVKAFGPYIRTQDGGAQVQVRIALRNSGNSPAMGVFPLVKIFLHNLHGRVERTEEVSEEREKLCKASAAAVGGIASQTIFPTLELVNNDTLTVSAQDLKDATFYRFINMSVLLCAAYAPSFQKNIYATGMIVNVRKAVPGNSLINVEVAETDQTIPVNQLILEPDSIYGVLAK